MFVAIVLQDHLQHSLFSLFTIACSRFGNLRSGSCCCDLRCLCLSDGFLLRIVRNNIFYGDRLWLDILRERIVRLCFCQRFCFGRHLILWLLFLGCCRLSHGHCFCIVQNHFLLFCLCRSLRVVLGVVSCFSRRVDLRHRQPLVVILCRVFVIIDGF